MLRPASLLLLSCAWSGVLVADGPSPTRCELIPLPDYQVSFQIDGVEKTRWHFGKQYPRPFLYPINGPSGTTLTRMGHPGAPNHDHHRSVWFAHHDVNGRDFWSDGKGNQIRQKTWYAYREADDETIMAAQLGWFAESGQELMQQDVVVALIPLPNGEHGVELQITMRPGAKFQTVELGKTNFGFLAVRVAKTISAHFGSGVLSSSEGQTGEADIFGKRSSWVDYSGPVAVGRGETRRAVVEGITYFDHPDNPRYPTHWHVRDDGWMGASFCLIEGFTITRDRPLTLRYLLRAHSSSYGHESAEAVHKAFAARPAFEIAQASQPHHQYSVNRRRLER